MIKDDYLEQLSKVWRVSIEETDTHILINGHPYAKILFWYMIEAYGPSQTRQILPKEVWNDH
jgi:hypothetical protein